MKQQLKKRMIAFIIVLVSITASSQTTANAPWTPENGYWVVEQKIHNRFNHIVRFYNDDHQLIYTETLSNVKMNPDKKKTKMKLKKALEDSLVRWEKNKSPETNKGYVVAALK